MASWHFYLVNKIFCLYYMVKDILPLYVEMVHWIYVLECEDDYIYIGETTRLYTRFREHIYRNGSVNTTRREPYKLIGLYKVGNNYSFYKYRNEIRNGEYNQFTVNDWGDDERSGNLLIENHFTELFMYLRCEEDNFLFDDGYWNKVRGGKYTKQIYSNPTTKMNIEDILDRPLCDCGLPSEVKLSNDKTKIYFVCALKNIWDDMNIDLDVDEPCEFFKVYEDDLYIVKQYEIIQHKLRENKWVKNLPKSAYKIHSEPCILCKKENYTPIWCYGETKKVCQPCFSNKYDELKQKFDISSISLFIDDD